MAPWWLRTKSDEVPDGGDTQVTPSKSELEEATVPSREEEKSSEAREAQPQRPAETASETREKEAKASSRRTSLTGEKTPKEAAPEESPPATARSEEKASEVPAAEERPRRRRRRRRRRTGSRVAATESPATAQPQRGGSAKAEQAQTSGDRSAGEQSAGDEPSAGQPPADRPSGERVVEKGRQKGQRQRAPKEPESGQQAEGGPSVGDQAREQPRTLETGDPTTGLERGIVFTLPERQSFQDERKIAMFCDFENIALGVRDSEIKKLDINIVLSRLLEKGKIIVKKAYADWERYSVHKRPFHEAAIELIDIPQKYYSGKNSADIKMVVDAMDLCYSKEHLDTFVILSGDSDFSPLVSKLKENNKYVIGIGMKNASSSLLIDNCDEFIYYEDVWRDSQQKPGLDRLPPKEAEVFGLMSDAMLALIRENKGVLWGSMIKQTMQRMRPSFSESYYGYSTFSELLEDAAQKNVIGLKRDQRSGNYVVTGFIPSR